MNVAYADARRWLEDFEAVARVDRDAIRRQGPRPEWSIGASLSLLRAALLAAPGGRLSDPGRTREEDAVRLVWERLRSGRQI